MSEISNLEWIIIFLLAVINYPIIMFVEYLSRRDDIKLTYQLDISPSQLNREKRNGLITTPIHAILFLIFLNFDWLHITSESLSVFVFTFATAFIWTEIWHYISHVAMHTKPLHFIHREHHKSRVTNVWTSTSFSLLEKLIFSIGIIGLIAIVSQRISISLLGLSTYYLLYFYTNALGHANFEFRNSNYYNTMMGRVFNTPSYHAMHHARYTHNYGLLTPWLDRIFGTAWEDYILVQIRAAEGKPLKGLHERA